MLDSLTKQGRKLKQRLRGKKNKPDKTGANTTEEMVDSPSSLLQSVPHIAAGSHGGAGGRTSKDEGRIHPGARSSQPESVSVVGREEDGDEKEVRKERSRPDPDAGVVEDIEPSREAERVHPSPSSPSIPPPTGQLESA
jgi:hypothetical protein